ncbi:MAG: hypothetical protein MJ252_07305, partial [archaeon]|nr:hypothetical protein [archaeon]
MGSSNSQVFTSSDYKRIREPLGGGKINSLSSIFDFYKRNNQKGLKIEQLLEILKIDDNIYQNENFFSDLFKMFAEEKTLEIDKKNFAILYYLFTTEYNDLKKKFFIEMFYFPKKNEISIEEYTKKAMKYFENKLKIFCDSKAVDTLSKNKKKDISKDRFTQNLEHFQNIIKEMKIKQFEETKENCEFSRNKNYICYCNEKRKISQNAEVEGEINEKYNLMKYEFEKVESLNNGVFPISIFGGYMKEIKVYEKIANIVERYLLRKTNRNFIDFDSFKQFLLSFGLCSTSEQKENIIFELMVYMNDNQILEEFFSNDDSMILRESLNRSRANSISEEDTNDTKESLIEKLKSLESEDIRNLIENIPDSIDKISVIPFIFFGVHPFLPIHFKILVENILFERKDYDYFLRDWIIQNDIFYAVDSKFIYNVKNYIQLNEYDKIVPEINLRIISGVNNRSAIKKGLKFKKDYFLFPKSIYEKYLRNWFEVKGLDIPLRRIIYDASPELLPTESNSLEDNIVLSEDKKKIYEIELYPIVVKFYTYKYLYEELLNKGLELKEETLNLIITKLVQEQVIMSDNCFKITRKAKISRLLELVKEKLGTLKDLYFPKFYLYSTYIYDTDEIDGNETLENQKMESVILVLIDSKVHKNNENDLSYKNKIIGKEDEYYHEFDEGESIGMYMQRRDSLRSSHFSSIYKKKTAFLVRLNNLGNTDYMNSVLQCIINLDYIQCSLCTIVDRIDFCVNKIEPNSYKGDLFKEFIKIVNYLYEYKQKAKDDELIEPRRFFNACAKINPNFGILTRAQNITEYFRFLLNNLHQQLKFLNHFNEENYKENEDTYKLYPNNNEGDFHWANYISKGPGIINSLFGFQLKEELSCPVCNKTLTKYRVDNVLEVEIPKNKSINLTLVINRLSFLYKIYYDKKRASFNYNNHKSKQAQLFTYLNKKINKNQSKKILDTNFSFKMKLKIDRNLKISDILKVIREKNGLELENEEKEEIDTDKITSQCIDYTLTKYKINSFTTLIPLIIEGINDGDNFGVLKFLDPLKKIDELLVDNDTVYIYEVLNYNGIQNLSSDRPNYKNLLEYSIYTNVINHRGSISSDLNYKEDTFDDILTKSKFNEIERNSNNLLSYNNYISFYSNVNSTYEFRTKNMSYFEFPIRVLHYYQEIRRNYYFSPFRRVSIDLPLDIILVNNIDNKKGNNQNYLAKDLYNLIWEKYRIYLKEPNKKKDELWWNRKENNCGKVCYPFMLKLCYFDEKKYLRCSQCSWYNFCDGCILNPFSQEALVFDCNYVLVVEWCLQIYNEEFLTKNFRFSVMDNGENEEEK